MKRPDFRHWVDIQVRWSDMDSLGHVNNSRYFTYMETGRISYISSSGIWAPGKPARYGPILVQASCDFRRQLRYPAELEIGTRLVGIGTSSMALEQGIFLKGDSEPVAEGSSVLAWVDYEAGSSVPLPTEFRSRLQSFEKAAVITTGDGDAQ